MNENIKISDLIPTFVDAFKKMIKPERIEQMAVALDYKEQIEETKQLENMSMEDFIKFKDNNPKRRVMITKVITEDDCEVVEFITKQNPQTKDEFIVSYLMNLVAEEWRNLAFKGEMIMRQKILEKEFNNII